MFSVKKLTLGLILVLFSLTPSFAGDSSSGCGVGWMVFKDNSLISSALRATTNAMFLNTVAMTFGTSGCARHSIVENDKKSLHYMASNKNQLMVEVAMGGGEHVAALSELMGCEQTVFSQVLQRNYTDVFSGETPRSLVNNVQAQILMNRDLAHGCGLI